jgi:hypothetical protein
LSPASPFWLEFLLRLADQDVRNNHGRLTREVRGQGMVATIVVSFVLSLFAKAVRKLLPRRHGAGK